MLNTPLVFLIVCFSSSASRAALPFPATPTNFHGISLYTFSLGAGQVFVLVPEKAAPGNPWMLAGSLYSLQSAPVANMTRTELELVRRGFHVVVSDPGNTFGAPDAIAKWDDVYAEMTQRYGLSKYLSLMGVSREGLAIAGWAAGHPGKVCCLYMDKAVCDFKSWPGGKLGISQGSPENWQSLLKLYHFNSEADALAWKQNPVDLAEKLAQDNVAIVYVTGAKDDAVPYAENGARMEDIYQRSGGLFRLFRREDEGHHPHGLSDPTPIVDFIERATTNETCDVLVYGGTSAGVIAAVQAARMGKSVILIASGKHLGGMTSGGLGWVDVGAPAAVGGLTRELFHRVWQHYQSDSAWKWQKRAKLREQHAPLPPGDETMWIPEPHVADLAFEEMAAESKVTIVRNERLNRKDGVHKVGSRLRGITMESGRTFTAKMFLDTTYEGDLMAAAGVSYFVGREANSRYGEHRNGIRPSIDTAQEIRTDRYKEQRIDPYKVKGDPKSGLLPRVYPDAGGKEFEEDDKVQTYCYRLCLTDVPENRLTIQKPEGYDESEYELVFRYAEAGAKSNSFLKLSIIPNRKTDCNNGCNFSLDYLGMSWAWAEADYATRDRIALAHEKWARGLLWTLQNHPRMPADTRAFHSRWGLAKDEFTENNGWPHQLYVREARRLVGEMVMTENMALGETPQPQDSVGLASYPFDSHAIKYYVDAASGFVAIEGGLSLPPWPYRLSKPFPISYRALLTKRGQCDNLLVPVCLSATHVAYGSIRMEPVFMVLGQSAATAAALALDQGVTLHDLPYETLKRRLAADHQVTVWTDAAARAK